MPESFPRVVPDYMASSMVDGVHRFSIFCQISSRNLNSWMKGLDYKQLLHHLNSFIQHEKTLNTHALTINRYITSIRCYISLYAKDHLIQSVDDILYCEFRTGMTSIEEIDIELLSKAYDNQAGKIEIRNRAILKLCINHSFGAASISRIMLSDYDPEKKELKGYIRKQRRIFTIEGSTLEALENWK